MNIAKAQRQEPVLFWTALSVALNVIQIAAIPVAPWLHIVILVLSAVASSFTARQGTVPAGDKVKVAKQLEKLRSI